MVKRNLFLLSFFVFTSSFATSLTSKRISAVSFSMETILTCRLMSENFNKQFKSSSQKKKFIEDVLNNLPRRSERDLESRKSCLLSMANDIRRDIFNQSHKKVLDVVNGEIVDQKETHFDTIILGAGIHSGIFSASLAKKGYPEKTLIIDSGEGFSQHFETNLFSINSPELKDKSTNEFPFSPVKIRDFSSKEYPEAYALWIVSFYTHFIGESHYLFHKKIQSINHSHKNAFTNYVINFNDGTQVTAKKIVIANGLGEARLDRFDSACQRFVAPILANVDKDLQVKRVPKVIFIDDFIRFEREFSRANDNFFNIFNNKKVAVVGAGDGGKVIVEYFSKQAPKVVYPRFFKDKGPRSILWVGQRMENYEDFSRNKETKSRYLPTFECIYSNGDLEFANKHLRNIAPIQGSSQVRLTDVDGRSFDVDYVVLTAGYFNPVLDFVRDVCPLESIDERNPWQYFSQINCGDSSCAMKLQWSEESYEEKIFLIGVAARDLASQRDLDLSDTKNPVSINVLGRKTARFGEEFSLY